MPTIVREGGFRVQVHSAPREHPPPHVHVERRGQGEVLIELGIHEPRLTIREVRGMRDRDVLTAVRIVERHYDRLMKAWRAIHG